MNIAGRAIAEIVTQLERPKVAVYHIINRNTTASWDTVLAGLKQAGVEFEAVDRTEWLDRLEQSDTDGKRNPAIKLLVRDSVHSSPRTTHADHDIRSHITATASVVQANGSL